ncbi:uncharacterized protein LOC132305534 [Cornus florida]|uniref:uncharacterized protein LOC132305534 n=1 Tax=Cornus florida TaxID=4283 RepID=UPI002896BC7B|nr:uncharacterized protein LOC132305534 [Cornus florida]
MIEMDKIVQDFLQRGALHYYEHKYNRAMMKFVKYFHSRDMIRTFLKNLNCLNELLLLEKEWGNLLEAAGIAKQKGDLLLEADLVEKAGQFREATMLILWYVFSNYLNPFRSKLRPVGQLNQKDGLLTRAKSIAKNHSDPFYEFAFKEVDILSKGNTYPEVLDIGLEFLQCWKQNAPTDVGRVKRIYEILIIEQKLLERCAQHYHFLKDKQTMMRYVKAFDSIDSIRILLKDLNCFDELLLLEEEWGNFLEAAKIAKQKGDLLHEAYLLEKARCLEAASMCG